MVGHAPFSIDWSPIRFSIREAEMNAAQNALATSKFCCLLNRLYLV